MVWSILLPLGKEHKTHLGVSQYAAGECTDSRDLTGPGIQAVCSKGEPTAKCLLNAQKARSAVGLWPKVSNKASEDKMADGACLDRGNRSIKWSLQLRFQALLLSESAKVTGWSQNDKASEAAVWPKAGGAYTTNSLDKLLSQQASGIISACS